MTPYQQELHDLFDDMPLAEKRDVVPYLRRMGYCVVLGICDADPWTPFHVYLPGHMMRCYPNGWSAMWYPATSPGMLRLRGVMWCMPRLLAWKWRAVSACWTPPHGLGYKRLCEQYRGVGALPSDA